VSGHWSESSVNSMASRLVLQGVGPDRFEPDASITRAEYAAILVRGFGLSDREAGSSFRDVEADAWFHGAVEQAHRLGIIEGYEDDRFDPDKTITREESFVMISRAMKRLGAEADMPSADAGLSGFTDGDQLADWAREAAAAAVQAGIVQGADRKLNPQQNITRAETAVLIERMLQSLKLIP